MNRNQEYENLLTELENTPPALEYTVARAGARAKKSQRVRRLLLAPASGFAAAFIVFVALVNLSMPFAMACGKIPVLRELAAAVAFSPSLSAAVDNEYVQIIGTEQTENGITMRVEYVIVDQKQLNIFYTLQSEEYFHMDAAPGILDTNGQNFGGYAISSGGSVRENGELRLFVVDFIDGDMPDSLILECRVHDNGSDVISAPVSADDVQPDEYSAPAPISVFSFTLTFDPEHTQQGETLTLNQDIILDRQCLTVTTVEIYPTHIRVNFTADENNTAWLHSLNFYFENEKGRRFDPISNGITATGAVDSPMMASHRLESSFFYKSRSLTMYITDVEWLDKDMERVRVDLAGGKVDRLLEGVELEQAVRRGGSWDLTFLAVERKKNSAYQLFSYIYFDEGGNEYSINSSSTSAVDSIDEAGEHVETPGMFKTRFALTDYPYDTVYLSPVFSRAVSLEFPVEVIVKP